MKPITTNSLSAWGYIGLILLFNLPYIGFPALIICAFFIKNHAVRSFARAMIILELIICVLAFVVILIGFGNLGDFLEDYYFNFSGDEGSAFISNIRYYLGV